MAKLYGLIWRNKYLTAHCTTVAEMAKVMQDCAAQLKSMADAGVEIDSGAADDYAVLFTDDPDVANRFGMQEEVLDGR